MNIKFFLENYFLINVNVIAFKDRILEGYQFFEKNLKKSINFDKNCNFKDS